MTTAIIYFSHLGNTKYAAEHMADILDADLIPLTPVKEYPDSGFKMIFWGGKSAVFGEKPKLQPYSFDPSAYDLVVFASPVWAGTFAPPLRTFIDDNRAALAGKPMAAFFCCSGGPGKVLDKFKAFYGAEPRQSLILVDPRDKPSPENEEKIKAFCSALM